jgi:hypothetical protein
MFSLFLFSGSPVRAAAPEIADRLVLSVSGSSYSQRHVAVWFVVRELLQEEAPTQKKKDKTPLLNEIATGWKTVIEKFSEDMVIRQEAARLGSFQPSAKAQVKATERITARRSVDQDMRATAAALVITDAEIASVTATILQVEGFRRSRDRQAPGAQDLSKDSSKDLSQNLSGGSWLGDLKVRSVIRIYDGGDTWVPLAFPGGITPAAPQQKESQSG